GDLAEHVLGRRAGEAQLARLALAIVAQPADRVDAALIDAALVVGEADRPDRADAVEAGPQPAHQSPGPEQRGDAGLHRRHSTRKANPGALQRQRADRVDAADDRTAGIRAAQVFVARHGDPVVGLGPRVR